MLRPLLVLAPVAVRLPPRCRAPRPRWVVVVTRWQLVQGMLFLLPPWEARLLFTSSRVEPMRLVAGLLILRVWSSWRRVTERS